MPAEVLYLTTDESRVDNVIVDKAVTLEDGNHEFDFGAGTRLNLSVFGKVIQVLKEGTVVSRAFTDEVFIHALSVFLSLKKMFQLSPDGTATLENNTFLRLEPEHPCKLIVVGYFNRAHSVGDRFDQLSDIAK